MMDIQAAKGEAAADDIEAALAFVDYSRWTHEPMVSEEYEKWSERQREAWHLAELKVEEDCHRQAILEYDHVLAVLADLPAALEALEEAQRCGDCADSPEDIRLPAGYRCYYCDKQFCGPHAKLHFERDEDLEEAQGKLKAVEEWRRNRPNSTMDWTSLDRILRSKEGNDG